MGQDRLPTRLSEFDVERYFALTDSDIAAVNERFRRDRRAGAAIQLVFLRASGHTLDHVGTLPRSCCATLASGSACLPDDRLASHAIPALQDAVRASGLGLRIPWPDVDWTGPLGGTGSVDATGRHRITRARRTAPACPGTAFACDFMNG